MTFRKAFDDADLDDLPDHLLRWNEALGRRMQRELESRIGDGREAPPSGRAGRLLQLIPEEGMRISDLAARARVTKQSLGQLVNVLEARGLVRSHDHPGDARVRIVRRTAAGDRLSRAMDSAIADVEDAFAAEVGPRRYATMKEVMRELGAGEI